MYQSFLMNQNFLMNQMHLEHLVVLVDQLLLELR
jgi:hypothetical protein